MQANADFVWANDANPNSHDVVVGNMQRAAQLRADQRQGATDALGQVEGDGREGTSDESCNQTGSVQGVKLEGLQG